MFVSPYFGPSGWLAIDVGEDGGTDWTFMAELIDTSYRQVALKRQLVALDAQAPHARDARAVQPGRGERSARPAVSSGTGGTSRSPVR